MRFGQKIPVSHVGIGHTQARFARLLVDDERVGRIDSRTEKAVDVVLDSDIRTRHTVKIGQIKARIKARSPVPVRRETVVCHRDAPVGTLSELVLYVVPFRELCLKSGRTVQLNREVFLRICPLCRDENNAVRSPTAV